MSMQEFLAKEGVTGKLKGGLHPPKNNTRLFGKELWDYLNHVADFKVGNEVHTCITSIG
jgi:hypothetical protein